MLVTTEKMVPYINEDNVMAKVIFQDGTMEVYFVNDVEAQRYSYLSICNIS